MISLRVHVVDHEIEFGGCRMQFLQKNAGTVFEPTREIREKCSEWCLHSSPHFQFSRGQILIKAGMQQLGLMCSCLGLCVAAWTYI